MRCLTPLVLTSALLSLFISVATEASGQQDHAVDVRVDPRIELLSIVFRLARFTGFASAEGTPLEPVEVSFTTR